MKSASNKFFRALITITVFLLGLALLMVQYFPGLLGIDHYLLMILFMAVVTSIMHLILLKVSQGKPQKFIRIFMIATMAKLVLYLLFVLSVAYYYRNQAAAILIGFLILYLCYTTLEVFFLRKHLDSQST